MLEVHVACLRPMLERYLLGKACFADVFLRFSLGSLEINGQPLKIYILPGFGCVACGRKSESGAKWLHILASRVHDGTCMSQDDLKEDESRMI